MVWARQVAGVTRVSSCGACNSSAAATVASAVKEHTHGGEAQIARRGVWQTITHITRTEGPFALYRGVGAVGRFRLCVSLFRHSPTPLVDLLRFPVPRPAPAALSAIPSHAAYFSTYEFTKDALGVKRSTHTPHLNALCGVAATLAHDMVPALRACAPLEALAHCMPFDIPHDPPRVCVLRLQCNTPMDVIKQRMQLENSPYRNIFHVRPVLFRACVVYGLHIFYP
jgi:hypothetical protein